MTLFDDSSAREFDSVSTVSEPSANSNEGQATDPSVKQPQAETHATPDQKPAMSTTATEENPNVSTAAAEEKPVAAPAADDFASALETFTTEAEEAVSEDRVIKGTVLKLTDKHVVVDIGAKSEGMLPLSEVLDAARNHHRPASAGDAVPGA